jgi:four helix bundle protein
MNQYLGTFRQLIAWQAGKKLTLEIYRLTKKFPREELYGLTSQMRRAAVSNMSNIAEGNQRSGNQDRIHFFEMALSSLTELDSQSDLCLDLGYLTKPEYDYLTELINKSAYLDFKLMDSIKSRNNPNHRNNPEYIETPNPNNRNNPNHRNNLKSVAGFTFVELIVVMSLMAALLALSAPMINSLRSEVAMRQTVHQAKTEIITGVGYAMAGKSIAALSDGNLKNADLIPSHYGLAFTAGMNAAGETPYRYVEFAVLKNSFSSRLATEIYSIEKEWPSYSIFLKEIRLKNDPSEEGISVPRLLVLFTPPFSTIAFVQNNETPEGTLMSFDPAAALDAAKNYKLAELTFKHKDNANSLSTLRISTDKNLEIL